jgi:hypothetical protein
MRMFREFPRNFQTIPRECFCQEEFHTRIPDEFHSELKRRLFGTHSELIWDAYEL